MNQCSCRASSKNPQPGPYRALIGQMRKQGAEYPQIWHLFASRPIAKPMRAICLASTSPASA